MLPRVRPDTTRLIQVSSEYRPLSRVSIDPTTTIRTTAIRNVHRNAAMAMSVSRSTLFACIRPYLSDGPSGKENGPGSFLPGPCGRHSELSGAATISLRLRPDWLLGRPLAAHLASSDLVHRDERRTTVARGGACQRSGDALEVLGCIDGVAQRLPADVEHTVGALDGNLLDRCHQDVGCVIRMRVEGLDRVLANFRLVLGEEVLVTGLEGREVGAREIVPGRGRPGSLHEV